MYPEDRQRIDQDETAIASANSRLDLLPRSPRVDSQGRQKNESGDDDECITPMRRCEYDVHCCVIDDYGPHRDNYAARSGAAFNVDQSVHMATKKPTILMAVPTFKAHAPNIGSIVLL